MPQRSHYLDWCEKIKEKYSSKGEYGFAGATLTFLQGEKESEQKKSGEERRLMLFFQDCACLFSKRNTDITSNIAKYSIEFHFLQGRKGQQSIAVKSFYDNYCSYCTMQN